MTLDRGNPRRALTAAVGGALAILLASACSGDDATGGDLDSGSRRDVSVAPEASRIDGSLDAPSEGGKADGDAGASTSVEARAEHDADAGALADADADDAQSEDAAASPVDANDALSAEAHDAGATADDSADDARRADGDGAAAQASFDAASDAALLDAAHDAGGITDEARDAGASAAPRYLVVVAHPDDDILFFNPDIASAIRAGATVRTLYMTSGDSMAQDWVAREAGVLAATASVAGVAGPWTCQARALGGNQLQSCTLPGAPRLSAIFLRILDTTLGPLWQLAPGRPFPLDNPAPSVTTKDGSSTYTRAQLTQMLVDIVHEFLPTRLMLMDSTQAYDSDFEHHDHVAAGMFGLAAGQAEGSSIVIYRNYSMFEGGDAEPSTAPNLTQAQYEEKVALMATYGLSIDVDDASDAYNGWCHRQYTTASVALAPGALRESGGSCLDVDGALSEGAAVVLAPCTGTPSQTWTVRSDARVVGAGGFCLTVAANGSSIVIGSCADTPQQRWTLFDNGQLRGVEGSCLGANGAVALVTTCGHEGVPLGPAASQTWTR